MRLVLLVLLGCCLSGFPAMAHTEDEAAEAGGFALVSHVMAALDEQRNELRQTREQLLHLQRVHGTSERGRSLGMDAGYSLSYSSLDALCKQSAAI